jgi:hypothetical protein
MANKLRILNSINNNKTEKRALRMPFDNKSDNKCIKNDDYQCNIKEEYANTNTEIVPLSFYKNRPPYSNNPTVSLNDIASYNSLKNNIQSMYCKDYISSTLTDGNMFENMFKHVIIY